MTRTIDHDAADALDLDPESFGIALDAANEASAAGLEPQGQVEHAIRAYLQAERERLGEKLHKPELIADVAEAWIRRKYTQHADARQRSMGLSYTTAETKDLARAFTRFALERQHLINTIAGDA